MGRNGGNFNLPTSKDRYISRLETKIEELEAKVEKLTNALIEEHSR